MQMGCLFDVNVNVQQARSRQATTKEPEVTVFCPFQMNCAQKINSLRNIEISRKLFSWIWLIHSRRTLYRRYPHAKQSNLSPPKIQMIYPGPPPALTDCNPQCIYVAPMPTCTAWRLRCRFQRPPVAIDSNLQQNSPTLTESAIMMIFQWLFHIINHYHPSRARFRFLLAVCAQMFL